MLPSSGTTLAEAWGITEQPLAERIAILEAKMEKVDDFIGRFDRTLEFRFRTQAEMLDERFANILAVMDKRFAQVFSVMDKRFAQVFTLMNKRFAQVDQNFLDVRNDLVAVQKDLSILREGMKIILQKLG
jgi:hypothetical protein